MKIKSNYKLREIAGENVIINQGITEANLTSIISLNTSAKLMWEKLINQEFNLEQAAKKYHLQLQRLAGKKAVDSLELYQYDFDSVLYKDVEKDTKKGKKK